MADDFDRHDHDEDDEEALVFDLEEAPPEVQEMIALSVGLAACLEAQSEVLARQREGILEIASQAAEVAGEILEWSPEEEGEELELPDDLAAAVEQLRQAGTELGEAARAARATLEEQAAGTGPGMALPAPSTGSGNFREEALATVYAATAQALAQSAQNTVAAQQQLNILGQAVLAASVSLIDSLVGLQAQRLAGGAGYDEDEDEDEED